MIVDVSAQLGHYPFARLRHTTANGLVAQMDRYAISHAVVTSVHALFYRNVHEANNELDEWVKPTPRLTPIPTIDPTYPGWEADLEAAASRGIKGLQLAPSYHGYGFDDEPARRVLEWAARLGVPVFLRQRFEDRRQRHLWDQAQDLQFRQVGVAARAHPEVRFVLQNWASLSPAMLLNAGLRGRCLVDFSRLSVVLQKTALRVVDALGIEALVFGTHMPFDTPAVSLIKLELLPVTHAEREAVAWRNAATFLELDPA